MRRAAAAAPRAGVALVAALGLLLLAAALLAGAAAATTELRRGTRSLAAGARAEAEVRRALGAMVQGWDSAAVALPVGASLARELTTPAADGPPVVAQGWIRRLSSRRYAAGVTVRVGAGTPALAFRRARLLLERDTAGVGAPVVPLARWSVVDLR